MKILARLAGADDDDERNNLLGLLSRYSMPKDVRQERDREVGKSIARTQVIATDVRGIEYVGDLVVQAISNTSVKAQRAAARAPYERERVDMAADVVSAVLARKVQELGGL
jgi:uncharacterized protein (UPF0218 family)